MVDGLALTTDFGLYVMFDGENRFKITIPESYSQKLCGLCGDYDGDPNNDFMLPNETLVEDVNDFGNSWKDEELSDLK